MEFQSETKRLFLTEIPDFPPLSIAAVHGIINHFLDPNLRPSETLIRRIITSLNLLRDTYIYGATFRHQSQISKDPNSMLRYVVSYKLST